MNFEDEEYVRVYCRDTPTTDRIGWEGRTVLWHLERVVPKSGVLELDENDDLVEVVASLCKLPEDLTKAGLERLASRGVTRRHAAAERTRVHPERAQWRARGQLSAFVRPLRDEPATATVSSHCDNSVPLWVREGAPAHTAPTANRLCSATP